MENLQPKCMEAQAEPEDRKRKGREDTENKLEGQEKEESVLVTRHVTITGIPQVDDQLQDHGRAGQGSSRGMDTLPKAHNIWRPLNRTRERAYQRRLSESK
jgi:hypothetical protein